MNIQRLIDKYEGKRNKNLSFEHCFYKKRFIRQCVEYDWCSKEYLEEVVDIKKDDIGEVE